MSQDTILTRLYEFLEFLGEIPGISELEGFSDYFNTLQLHINKNIISADKKHRTSLKNFLISNQDIIESPCLEMRLSGHMKLMVGRGCLDFEKMWAIIDTLEDSRMFKSDFLVYLYGVIEISQLMPDLDCDEMVDKVLEIFGKGVYESSKRSIEPTQKLNSIEDVFSGDTKEDKYLRSLLGDIGKTVKGDNPQASIAQMMNPANLTKMMGLISGNKKGIKIRKLMEKLVQVVPEDMEI